MANKPQFKDVQFMTAKQKELAWKNFKQVIDQRNPDLIHKELYQHLHLHCGFIAHYDIHGFRATYRNDFRRFIEHFDRNSRHGIYWCGDSDYADINQLMVDYVTEQAPRIYREMDEKRNAAELRLLEALAEKHGLLAVAQASQEKRDTMLTSSEGGQMRLFNA